MRVLPRGEEMTVWVMKEIIPSEAKNDCGVVAVACGTGRPWHHAWAAIQSGRAARKLGYHAAHDHDHSTTGRDLIDAAYRLGYRATTGAKAKPTRMENGYDMGEKLRVAPPGSWMAWKVQYADVRCSHWVVFDGQYVYDGRIIGVGQYTLQPLSYILFSPI